MAATNEEPTMRRPLIPALFAALLLAPLPALADEPNCPPGSWFCADANVDTPQAPDADDDTDQDNNSPQLPAKTKPQQQASDDDEDTPEIEEDRGVTRRPRVVVVEQPGGYATPPNVVIVTQSRPRPRVIQRAPAPPPARALPRLYSKWGLNLRVEGAAMGDGANVDSGMGGLGLSLRYRPVPHFGFDLGVDVVGGKDYNGFTRIETPVALNAMIFVNPRSRVQFYLIGGAHLSHAEVKSEYRSELLDSNGDGTYGAQYNYFGGQGGAGLEFRIGRRVGLSFDVLGFIRKRTDDNPKPEYVDAITGNTTNTSGGVLFRGGLNFWW
jgi:Outer membrane protein beta-barrel domain